MVFVRDYRICYFQREYPSIRKRAIIEPCGRMLLQNESPYFQGLTEMGIQKETAIFINSLVQLNASWNYRTSTCGNISPLSVSLRITLSTLIVSDFRHPIAPIIASWANAQLCLLGACECQLFFVP